MPEVKIVEKPWGREEWWAVTPRYVGKILYINAGHRLSLQYHRVKVETMRVLSGSIAFTLGEDVLRLSAGDVVHVPAGTIHRMEALEGGAEILEVSTPEVDDVVRVSDDYQR